MEFVGLCAVFMAVCAVCAGICAGTVMGMHRRPDGTHLKPMQDGAEEAQKESERRRQEIQNFFNYNGDVMPKAEEKETDRQA